MGTWGTAIFSDDFAADVKREYQTLLAFGTPPMEAYQLVREYFIKDQDEDDNDYHTFFFAIASIQRKYGLLTQEVKDTALKIIDSGESMEIWEESADSKEVAKRKSVLEKLKADLLSPPLPQRKVSKLRFQKHRWDVGDIISCKIILDRDKYRWTHNKYVLFRVTEIDKNSLSRIKSDLVYDEWVRVILYDWMGDNIPDETAIEKTDYFIYAQPNGWDKSPGVHLITLNWFPKYYELKLVKHDKNFVMPHDLPMSRHKDNIFALIGIEQIVHFKEIYEKNKTIV
jgi:hypothetical protein